MRAKERLARAGAAAAKAATEAAAMAGESPDDALARRTAVRNMQKEELAQRIAESKVTTHIDCIWY